MGDDDIDAKASDDQPKPNTETEDLGPDPEANGKGGKK